MNKDITVYLDDILEAIDKIKEYVGDMDEASFSQNSVVEDAVIRRLSIIGEAAAKIPESIRKESPDVPWRKIVGLRNVVIHEYSGVSMGRVWLVIQNELTSLREAVTNMKEKIQEKAKP